MQFNVSHLLRQPVGEARTYELEEDIAAVYDDLNPVRALTGRVKLTRIPSGLLVSGTLRTALAVDCSRCLEPVTADVDIQLEEMFRPLTDVNSGRFLHPREYEGEDEVQFDEALLIDEGHQLDLREVVRQHLWIEALQYSTCDYAKPEECPHFQESRRELARVNGRGPEPAATEERNVDPRWAALLPLLEETRESDPDPDAKD